MIGVLGMALLGAVRAAHGTLPQVESAQDTIIPAPGYPTNGSLTGLALVFLLARAFSSGCAALTGVEAISNGVPAFRKPKSKNAATTLLLLGDHRDHDAAEHHRAGQPDGPEVRRHTTDRLLRARRSADAARATTSTTVIAQLSKAVFDNFTPGFYFVLAMTGIILVLAANTAFNGFPVLGSILARDGFMPRALGSRGDRLAYSNGIIILAGFAIVLIVAFDAQTDPADPALHRRRLRLVQPQPARA